MAIKKISNAFDNATDSRRTLREIKLLRHLRHGKLRPLLAHLTPVHNRTQAISSLSHPPHTSLTNCAAFSAENVIALKDILSPPSLLEFNDVYLVCVPHPTAQDAPLASPASASHHQSQLVIFYLPEALLCRAGTS